MPPQADDTLRCHRCRRTRTTDELDRTLWCDDCRLAERRRAAWWGRAAGFAGAVALSLWIAIRIQPSDQFLILWATVVIVAFYLFSRLGQELIYGVIRVRNVPATRADDDAFPEPGLEPGDEDAREGRG
jgi:hypothetical protein